MLVPKALAALVGQVLSGHMLSWVFLGSRFPHAPVPSLVLSQLGGTSILPHRSHLSLPWTFVGGHLGGEAVFTYHGETGRLHSKSLPSSTFLGLLQVTMLSWHWRSKFLFWLKSVRVNNCGPHTHRPVP